MKSVMPLLQSDQTDWSVMRERIETPLIVMTLLYLRLLICGCMHCPL